jgi:hypothetical protein
VSRNGSGCRLDCLTMILVTAAFAAAVITGVVIWL